MLICQVTVVPKSVPGTGCEAEIHPEGNVSKNVEMSVVVNLSHNLLLKSFDIPNFN